MYLFINGFNCLMPKNYNYEHPNMQSHQRCKFNYFYYIMSPYFIIVNFVVSLKMEVNISESLENL